MVVWDGKGWQALSPARKLSCPILGTLPPESRGKAWLSALIITMPEGIEERPVSHKCDYLRIQAFAFQVREGKRVEFKMPLSLLMGKS